MLAVYQSLADEFIDQFVAPVRTVGLLADLLNGDSGSGLDRGEDLLSASHDHVGMNEPIVRIDELSTCGRAEGLDG